MTDKFTNNTANKALKSAIILAGGRSSRMGQDKALLQLAGQSQLTRTVALAKACGCDQILISRNQPGFIYDLYPDAGPLAGIQAALLQVQAPTCLILAVDTPLLDADLLSLLWQYPCASFTGSPLPAVIPNNRAVRHWLSHLLQQHHSANHEESNGAKLSGLSVAALLQHCGAQMLPCPTPEMLLNTNTPGEWCQATAAYQRKQQQYHQLKETLPYGQNR